MDKGGPFQIGLSTGPAQLLASKAASGMGTRLHQRSKPREQIAPSSCCSWSEQTDHFGMHAGRRLEGSRQGRQLMEPLNPHRFRAGRLLHPKQLQLIVLSPVPLQ